MVPHLRILSRYPKVLLLSTYIDWHNVDCVATAPSLSVAVEASEERQGQAVGGLASPVAKRDPNSVKCENCYRYIPSASYSMHTIMCARNNWACVECGKVMPRRDKENHGHCDLCSEIVAPHDLSKHKDLYHKKARFCFHHHRKLLLMPYRHSDSLLFILR